MKYWAQLDENKIRMLRQTITVDMSILESYLHKKLLLIHFTPFVYVYWNALQSMSFLLNYFTEKADSLLKKSLCKT